jgi:hypothetical protein
LAEFGVVFLMFVIGLEFNLPKLMRMRKLVFGLGLGQVVLTLIGAFLFNLAVGFALKELGYIWRLSWQASIALGSALAMSSTAIVVKLMADRVEMESPHGQRVMGVSRFGCCAAAGAHPCAGRHGRAQHLGSAVHRHAQSRCAGGFAALGWSTRHASMAAHGVAPQER